MRGTITINLTNLKSNYRKIKEFTNKEVISVIKSNAYGHGLVSCARALEEEGCNFFVVATMEEGMELRNNNIHSSIMVLEQSYNFFNYIKYNLICSISSIDQLMKVLSFKRPINLHIKIDTGLNRLGIKEEDINKVVSSLEKSMHKVDGIYTHFASEETYDNQNAIFTRIIDKCSSLKPKIIHSNSSSYIGKDNGCSHIRVGLSLFGYSSILSLNKVLSFIVPIYRKNIVKKHEMVGYHDQEEIPQDGFLYTIPLGYADGWNPIIRTFGFTDELLIQIGETCMDHMMLFSTNDFDGNYIEVIGENVPISLQLRNTELTPYQLLSTLSQRIDRTYVK